MQSAEARGYRHEPCTCCDYGDAVGLSGLGSTGCSSSDGHPTSSDDVASLVGAAGSRGIGSVSNGHAPGSAANASQAQRRRQHSVTVSR